MRKWLVRIVEYFISNGATRVLAAVSGLIAVRNSEVNEYALYTLLLTVFSFVCVVSDLGLTESLGYFRRRLKNSSTDWRLYRSVITRIRYMMCIVALTAGFVYFHHVSKDIDIEMSYGFPSYALMAVAALVSVGLSINIYTLRLELRFRDVYKSEVTSEIAKLAIVGIAVVSLTVDARLLMVSVLLAAIAGFGITRLSLKSEFRTRLNSFNFSPLSDSRRRAKLVAGQIVPVAPSLLHFSLQSILIAWLAVKAGGSVSLAEIGALGRITAILSPLLGAINTIVVPALANIESIDRLRRKFIAVLLTTAVLSCVVFIATNFYPKLFLILLGERYIHLESEIVLTVATSLLLAMNGLFFGINRFLGWVAHQKYQLPSLLAVQAILIVGFEMNSTYDVLLFALSSSATWLVVQSVGSLFGFAKATKEK